MHSLTQIILACGFSVFLFFIGEGINTLLHALASDLCGPLED